MASRPLSIALVVTALVTFARMTGTVDSDVAWQLWIAQRIHAGANLYRDIIETNPPLWFWMALPVDRVATLLHARPEAVLAAGIGLLVGLALAATNRLILHIDPKRRALLLGYIALTLAAMPWVHVGQREQLVLIATVPYAALVAARREGRAIPPSLAILIGIGAALAFALKQYFLIVPIMLELWLLAGQRKSWRPLRPETATIIGVGLAYGVSILFFEPDFLTTIVPLIRLAYGGFGAPSLRYMFGSPFALAGLLTLAFAAAQAPLYAHRRAPLAEALLVAAVAFAAIYFIQFKGWWYHAIPLVGCASLTLAALLAELESQPTLVRIVAPGLLALPLLVSAKEYLDTRVSQDLIEATSGLAAGNTIGFLTTEPALPWSVTMQSHYRYASRYSGFWMMRAIFANERRANPDSRLTALGRRIISETIADFTCIPPRRIIVWRPRPGEDGMDVLPFFLRDPRFAELLSHYRIRGRTSLETYELVSPLRRPAIRCRAGF